MLSFYASLHISQEETIPLFFQSLLLFKYAFFMILFFWKFLKFIVASLIFSVAFRVEILLLQRHSLWYIVALFYMMFGMFSFLFEQNRGASWVISRGNLNLLLFAIIILSLTTVFIFFLEHRANIFLFWVLLLFFRFFNRSYLRFVQGTFLL